MIIEKLLLQVLIVLSPVLVYSVISNGKKEPRFPFLTVFYAIAGVLCIVFSYQTFGLYWDLRYVIVVCAFLYGGMKTGWLVFATVMITRTMMGGDHLVFAYVCITSAALTAFFFQTKYQNILSKWRRTLIAIVLSLVPVVIQISIVSLLIREEVLHFFDESVLGRYLFYYVIVIMIAAGFITLLHEAINEKKRMQEEIIRAEKFNTLAGLAASIAHEVRNPLTVVKGFLQLMKEENKDSSQQYYSLVLNELGRAENIINDYLNFAKPELKSVEDVKLLENIHEIHALLHPYAIKDGVHLNELIEISDHLVVRADRNQLKQALVNFVKNAIEATPNGGNVTLVVQKSTDLVTIHISDTGKGMNKEELSRIGTLFYTTKDKGTGLGTMVSIRIIEAMGGTVSYQSKEFVGTTVSISLPIRRDETSSIHTFKDKNRKVI
ncbi:ATP-binding protein [Alkalihalophilus sp. As8PL]|uniref:histidine kinase n=1 Tax=Alkalihalophilus sp. As8PL TaxID=3237103 RepID=A0AB39BXB7_9BACI